MDGNSGGKTCDGALPWMSDDVMKETIKSNHLFT